MLKLKFWEPKTTDKFEIIVGKPPVFDMVSAAFQVNPINALFTYGNKIYNPGNNPVPEYLVVHEKVHMVQQNWNDKDAALWWGKFLRDPEFRIDQESRAYGTQYAWMCKNMKEYRGRDQQFQLRVGLARILAGPLYDNCISHGEAMGLIKQHAHLPEPEEPIDDQS